MWSNHYLMGGGDSSSIIDGNVWVQKIILMTAFKVVSNWTPIEATGEDGFILYYLHMQNYRSERQTARECFDLD